MNLLNEYGIDYITRSVVLSVVVVLTAWEAIKKLLDLFNTYYKKRKATEKSAKSIKALTESDKVQDEELRIIMGAVKVQLRHSIVRIAEESMKAGFIGAYELQSLEELFTTYCDDLHGNSYVHNLMKKVRRLPVDYTNGNPNE